MNKSFQIFIIFFTSSLLLISNTYSEELWHLEKKIIGLTYADINQDKVKEIITIGPPGEMCAYNYDGTLSRCLPVSPKISQIKTAQLNKDPQLEIIGFTPLLSGIYALDSEGHTLWNFDVTNINDIAPIDINQDGIDEIIVGYNGQEGIALLDSQGEVLWQQGLLWAWIH